MATETAPAATSAVVPVPAPTEAQRTSLTPDQAREKARAAIRAAESPQTPAQSPPAVPVKIEMDPESLKTVAKLSTEAREWQNKHAALETETKTIREAQKLFSEGKRMEAIGLLSGKDASLAMEEMLSAYLDVPGAEPKAEAPKSAEQIQIDELKAKLQAKDDAEAKAIATQKQDAARAFAVKLIDPVKFPVSAREQNQVEAANAALAGAFKIASEENLDINALNDEQCAALITRAMKEVESDFQALGARYAYSAPNAVSNSRPEIIQQVVPAKEPEKTQATISELPRPGITTEQGRKNLTLAEAKERALKSFLAIQRQN